MPYLIKIMNELTVIFLTANEQPRQFAKYQKETLLAATEGHELISVSRQPINLGKNILDKGEKSHINMYFQLMNAAKIASTPYIAVAEDDVLYPKEHFNSFRPPLDTFAYNMHRWLLYTWKPTVFSMKRRISNCTLIAPRQLFIEAWQERFAKYPIEKYPKRLVGEVGRKHIDEWLGVTERKSVEFWSSIGVVHVNHPHGTDSLGTRKKMGEVKAIEIPYWGRAEDVVKHYK